MRHASLLALASCLARAPAARAGVVVDIEHRLLSPASAKPDVSRLTAQGNRLKVSVLESADGRAGDAMIFDGDAQKLWALEGASRTYFVMDRAQVDQVGAAMAGIQAQLANLPPEQRAMAEQMMQGRMGGPPPGASAPPAADEEVRKTPDRADKNGYAARRVEVWSDGRKVREHWVTDWSAVGVSLDDFRVFEAFSKFMEQLAGVPGGKAKVDNPMRSLDQLGGVPVVTIDYQDGRPHSETVLKSMRKADVPAADLALPAGYTEKAMPGGRSPRRG